MTLKSFEKFKILCGLLTLKTNSRQGRGYLLLLFHILAPIQFSRMTAKEIFDLLNEADEQTHIEAKAGGAVSNSVMETICAFSNEPGLGGGYILLGAKEDNLSLFPQYTVDEIKDPDKIQSDLASKCSSMFNIAIRPRIKIEKVNDKNVAVIKVDELAQNQKPLFFRSENLPRGAFRRIGPTDHRCTEDDLHIFYSDSASYDQSALNTTSLKDVDENAIERYRDLRERLNPAAEELTYDDQELLISLGCMDYASDKLTVAGLLLFGKASSLRRIFPLVRVDYIRVPGNQWVEDPDNRFSTIDMRGPLILLIYRIVDAVYSDLPKAFKLPDEELQANSMGLPVKALREALINAVMHRSYRENSPIQVIRYDNRLEIINPGFSLKSEDQLGKPGSQSRNPHIAGVFHETNLAETKGSGIRAMKALLKNAKLAPPTFESDRNNNRFTARLLLHHFLSDKDLKWLTHFEDLDLNDHQKQALIFIREVGAIDNNTYRQISDSDSFKASTELRFLRSQKLLRQKGKGRGTYYVEGPALILKVTEDHSEVVNSSSSSTNTEAFNLNPEGKGLNTEGKVLNTEGKGLNTEGEIEAKHVLEEKDPKILQDLSGETIMKLVTLKKREANKEKIKSLIEEICMNRAFTLKELAHLLGKQEDWISRTYISPLIKEGRIDYAIPEMVNHPKQAYIAAAK